MKKPDWRNFSLAEGILREPLPDGNQIVLWVPVPREKEGLPWERIASVPGEEIYCEEGLCYTQANLLPTRQKKENFLTRLWHRFHSPTESQFWLLPNGATAEQTGTRQTNLVLVWPEGDNLLEETAIQERWPLSRRRTKLGQNLYLVDGLENPPEIPRQETPTPGLPLQQAEALLAAARQSGDRPREATALTDLGIAYLRGEDPRRAMPILEEALNLSRQLGDPARECDVLGNLGLAVLAHGQGERSLELLEQQLILARQTGNQYEEKNALENFGVAYSSGGDHAGAVRAFTLALGLATTLEDRKHQADLLWYLAIENAELGQRDQAVKRAQASLQVFQAMNSPHVHLLQTHLRRYLEGNADTRLEGLPSTEEAASATPAASPTSGPGLLKMAISAAKAMAHFIGSGMKTVTPAMQQKRLRICAACPHHTGVRCKLCGCFTSLKSWLPHENCPIGRWPNSCGG